MNINDEKFKVYVKSAQCSQNRVFDCTKFVMVMVIVLISQSKNWIATT